MEDVHPASSRSKQLKVTEFLALTFEFVFLSYIVYVCRGLYFASLLKIMMEICVALSIGSFTRKYLPFTLRIIMGTFYCLQS